MVGRELVGPLPEDLVVQGRGIHFDVAADQVVHPDDASFGHPEADRPVGTLREQALHLALRQGERVAQGAAGGMAVDEGLTARLGLGAFLLQLLGRVESVVGVAGGDELLGVFPVDDAPLALAVGGVGMGIGRLFDDFPLRVHPFVGVDAAPAQRLDDILLGPGHEAVGVRVLDAEDEGPAVLLGVEVVVEGGAHAAHMQRSGRRRGEPYAGLSHTWVLRMAGMFSSSARRSPLATIRAGFSSGSNLKFRTLLLVLKPICWEPVSS